MRYIWLAFRYNLQGQIGRKLEFIAGTASMIINNIIYFGGVSVFIFQGRPENEKYFSYYLGTQTVLFISWGAINFLSRGFRELGTFIESGHLESFLARPKNPLILAAVSRTDITAAGDLIQGVLMIPVCGHLFGWDFSVRIILGSLLAIVGVYSLMVFAGALAFFASRGAALSDFIVNAALILLGWPIGPKLKEIERIFLILTPVGAAILLPMEAVWNSTLASWGWAVLGTFVSAVLSTAFFFLGLRNFQSSNMIRLQG